MRVSATEQEVERIRQMMDIKGLRTVDVARAAKISVARLSALLTGKSRGIVTARKACRVLGIPFRMEQVS